MSRIAQIKDGVVVNVIEAQLEWAQQHANEGFDEVRETDSAGPGWLYQDGVFSAPPAPIVEAPVSSAVLTQLEFIRRFTLSERVKVQTSDDPIMQDALLMLQVAQHVDLADPDTIAFVQYAAYNNYIEPHRVAEILGE